MYRNIDIPEAIPLWLSAFQRGSVGWRKHLSRDVSGPTPLNHSLLNDGCSLAAPLPESSRWAVAFHHLVNFIFCQEKKNITYFSYTKSAICSFGLNNGFVDPYDHWEMEGLRKGMMLWNRNASEYNYFRRKGKPSKVFFFLNNFSFLDARHKTIKNKNPLERLEKLFLLL